VKKKKQRLNTQNKFDNINKISLRKLKITKFDNLVGFKSGAILSENSPETDNDT